MQGMDFPKENQTLAGSIYRCQFRAYIALGVAEKPKGRFSTSC